MPYHSNKPFGRALRGAVDNDHCPFMNNGDRHGEEHLVDNNLSCCTPLGCSHQKLSKDDCSDPVSSPDIVRILCNNENCDQENWMHGTCFAQWEQHVLSFLRSCGRARSWSEKQRMQNIWTKKGYDLAFKVCDCKCGRGHIRKDLDHIPEPKLNCTRPRKNKKKAGEHALPQLPKTQNHVNTGATNSVHTTGISSSHKQLRIRTLSASSTGSSPPSSGGTPPVSPTAKSKFDFFADPAQAATGNIFRRRTDFSVFNVLPRYLQNAYHIKMEDDGPHGNDETRSFVLTSLSTYQITSMICATCQVDMPVFDKYPLIDGTFFLSPQNYNSEVQVAFQQKMMYLNAVCMQCLTGYREQIQCKACLSKWVGVMFVIGTMYSYDIFAAMPCCAQRLSCKSCQRAILDPECSLNFFCDHSKIVRCPHCNVEDYHFIKPLPDVFTFTHPLCNS